MTNDRRRLDLARKTLCLSCCTPMEHGYCQACWENESRRYRERRPADQTLARFGYSWDQFRARDDRKDG